jgi:hypothetical protein
VLAVFVLFVLKYFFDGYFFVCLLVPSEKDNAKGSFSSHALKLVPIFASKFSGIFLGAVFFLLSFKSFIGLSS